MTALGGLAGGALGILVLGALAAALALAFGSARRTTTSLEEFASRVRRRAILIASSALIGWFAVVVVLILAGAPLAPGVSGAVGGLIVIVSIVAWSRATTAWRHEGADEQTDRLEGES